MGEAALSVRADHNLVRNPHSNKSNKGQAKYALVEQYEIIILEKWNGEE